MHISLAYGKGRFSKLCHRPLKVDKAGVYLFYHFSYSVQLESSEQKRGQKSYSLFGKQFGCYVLYCVRQDIL